VIPALVQACALRAAVAALALAPVVADAGEARLCAAPPGGLPIIAPLEHVAARITEGGPLNIVAVGSSSTSGIGASSPDLGYPSRLEVELRTLFPQLEVHVVNRGRSGEDAPEEFARLASDVVASHPDLAIWQVGTNAVLRRDDLAADGELMHQGVELLKRNGIDVVLMDLQYAPRVLDRPAYATMEDLVADTADDAHVGLFRRFALMRYWHETSGVPFEAFLSPDQLHMNDWSYGCTARYLGAAIAEAVSIELAAQPKATKTELMHASAPLAAGQAAER